MIFDENGLLANDKYDEYIVLIEEMNEKIREIFNKMKKEEATVVELKLMHRQLDTELSVESSYAIFEYTSRDKKDK